MGNQQTENFRSHLKYRKMNLIFRLFFLSRKMQNKIKGEEEKKYG